MALGAAHTKCALSCTEGQCWGLSALNWLCEICAASIGAVQVRAITTEAERGKRSVLRELLVLAEAAAVNRPRY